MCPQAKETACDLSIPVPTWEVRKKDVIEKTVVTIKTVKPIGSATPIKGPGCTGTPTVTVTGVCPTYTCVPWCDPLQVVR
jgi:hypothetical protein